MKSKEITRIRNPFHDPLVTELIDDPSRYGKMFSLKILVGETLEVFQPSNAVLVGPQGSGKSMILNLVRYPVLSEWISMHGSPPAPLRHLPPFFGISVNLVRVNFHVFGKRSVSRVRGEKDENLDATCATDFLNHYLFLEFLKGVKFLFSLDGYRLKKWLGIHEENLQSENLYREASSWASWFGYYEDCNSLDALMKKCEYRLSVWRKFLNANIDHVPTDIWESKTLPGAPLHAMGNLLNSIGPKSRRLPLFVIIDQYEVLPELNPTYGTSLQRVVNTLIKARDPVVFYKIGARPYDWGTELRVFGAESRIEIQRDYVMIDLAEVLMRNEDKRDWLFPDFARDVAYKRVKTEGHYRISKHEIEKIFGSWSPIDEAAHYFRNKSRQFVVLKKLSNTIRDRIVYLCGKNPSPLDLRLAGAWALERKQRGVPEAKILEELGSKPWKIKKWWRKERIGVALLQIASLANQKKLYYGWKPLIYLSGANISNFLLLCSEIWDMASKMGIHPLKRRPLPYHIQTEGIYIASEKWRIRDQNEIIGGRHRYDVLNRLGPAIHDALVNDLAISNPGHSGFSLQETAFRNTTNAEKVEKFLHIAVNWAILEERKHTSKFQGDTTRRKWYLHPLLSPAFAIPYIRVKEPLYTKIDIVYNWFFEKERVEFRPLRKMQIKKENAQRQQWLFRKLE